MRLYQGYKVIKSKQLSLKRVSMEKLNGPCPGLPPPRRRGLCSRRHCAFLPSFQQLPSFPADWVGVILSCFDVLSLYFLVNNLEGALQMVHLPLWLQCKGASGKLPQKNTQLLSSHITQTTGCHSTSLLSLNHIFDGLA